MNHTVYAAVLERKGYVVGEANAPSGLHVLQADGSWKHSGWTNVRCFGLARHPGDEAVLFLAAGNGVLRSQDAGATWRVTTDWRITEVLDVALDPHDPSVVLAATAYGLWHSPDGGETWRQAGVGLPEPEGTFCPVIVADPTRPGRYLIGSEAGLFVSDDGGLSARPLALDGMPVRALARGDADPQRWLVGTEDHGAFLSSDGAATWDRCALPKQASTIYAAAVDPTNPDRLAVGGYRTGLLLSTDGGRTWSRSELDEADRSLHALAFEADGSGALWIGAVGAGMFVFDGQSGELHRAGLAEATIYDILVTATAPQPLP